MTVELGPWLSRLVAPPEPGSPAEGVLSEVRLRLLTGVFASSEWLPVWEGAVREATTVVLTEIQLRLRDAAQVSRYPARKLRQELPTQEDREILAARFSAAGMGLEARHSALGDSADVSASRRLGVSALDSGEVRLLCGELEVAWENLVRVADQELATAERRAARIRAWRRPLFPLVVGSAALLSLATWTGLVLGGYLESPGWFRPFAEWVWSW